MFQSTWRRQTLLLLAALAWCAALAFALSFGRLLSASVDISYHLQVLEAVRHRWILPPETQGYLAEQYVYPKGSQRIAALVANLGLSGLNSLVLVAVGSAAVGWLLLLDQARRVSVWVLLASAALALAGVVWLRAVLGGEVVGNFFYPQLVSEAVSIVGLVVGAAVLARSRWGFALYAPLVTAFAGWFHLIGALKLAGALCVLTVFEIGRRLVERRGIDWALALTLPLVAAALVLNPSFSAMRWMSQNNGSVNFAVLVSLPQLVAAAGALCAVAGLGLLAQLRRPWPIGDAAAERARQAAVLLLAFGAAAGAACLAQYGALMFLGEGSDYAVRKHGFGVFTGLAFSVPALAWSLRPIVVRPRTLGAVVMLAAHLAILLALFQRPNHLDSPEISNILEQVGEIRPSAEVGGDDYLFVSTSMEPVVSYMATIAMLRSERSTNALAVLATGDPTNPGEIERLVTEVGDPVYDKPRCRLGPPRGDVVVVSGPCVEAPAISFKAGGEGHTALTAGWDKPEPGGVWSLGRRAVITLPVDPRLAGIADPRAQVHAFGFVPAESPTRTVRAGVVGGAAETFTFDKAKALTHLFSLPIPPQAVREGRATVILDIADPVSPNALGLGVDTRTLGVGVEWARVVPSLAQPDAPARPPGGARSR